MRAHMKCKHLLLVAVFLLANCSLAFAQAAAPQPPTRVLHNGDVLRMHRAGMKPGDIITRIVTSPCNFDTFPQVLRELKMKAAGHRGNGDGHGAIWTSFRHTDDCARGRAG